MLERMKTLEGIARVNQALTSGERSVAEQIDHQLAQGEIAGVVRDGLRKADAEDLRFEDCVERGPPQIESEILRPRDAPIADAAAVPGGDGGDPFDAADFHRAVNDAVDRERADHIGADLGIDVDVVEADADIDFDELVKHW